MQPKLRSMRMRFKNKYDDFPGLVLCFLWSFLSKFVLIVVHLMAYKFFLL